MRLESRRKKEEKFVVRRAPHPLHHPKCGHGKENSDFCFNHLPEKERIELEEEFMGMARGEATKNHFPVLVVFIICKDHRQSIIITSTKDIEAFSVEPGSLDPLSRPEYVKIETPF